MAASTYDGALRRLLAHEGGYTNHPSDPGGPTNFGITIHDYRKCVKSDADAADVRAMRLEEAEAIYRRKYWDAQRCDELPAGIDYAVFDYGVNSGVGRSGKVLRRVLGMDSSSHVVTDAVVAAARKRNAAEVVVAICDERLAFLKRLKTWPTFGSGWGRRVAEVKQVALALAAKGGTSTTPQTKSAAGTTAGAAAAGSAVVAGAAAAQQAHQSGARIAIVVAIAFAALALAFFGWRWWQRRQIHQQESGQ
jgi:lysozyme family protein